MTKIRLETIVPMKKADFWKICYTKEYDEFQAPHLNLKMAKELKCEQKGDVIHRTCKVVPNVELPSALLWYLGQEEFHYLDEQEKDLKNEIVRFHTIPPVCQDRLDIRGEVRLIEIDENSCRQVMDLTIEVSAWGLGGILEGVMSSNLQTSTANIPIAVKAWKVAQEKKASGDSSSPSSEPIPTEPAKPVVEAKSQQPASQQQSTWLSSWFSR